MTSTQDENKMLTDNHFVKGRVVIGRFEPVVLEAGDQQVRVKAKVDPAADRSNVAELAVAMMAAEPEDDVQTRAGSVSEGRPTVNLSIYIPILGGAEPIEVEPNIKDRSNYTGNFLIGMDILETSCPMIDPLVDNFVGLDEVEVARQQ
jgi:hypothetical protein